MEIEMEVGLEESKKQSSKRKFGPKSFFPTLERVKLSISGTKYEIRWKTLLKFPNTRLGSLAAILQDSPAQFESTCDGYNKDTGEFFFERDPTAFPSILNYYITGKLHIPRSDCVKTFEEEVTYWGIPFKLGECCDSYYYGEWECTEAIKKADQLESTLKKTKKSKDVKPTRYQEMRTKLWNLVENPETSTGAKIVSVISNLIVILSTLVLCLNTHPGVQIIAKDGTKKDNPYVASIELACVIWFTVEYVARLVSCPNKRKFLRGKLNLIDVLAVLPYYIEAIIASTSGDVSSNFTNVRRFIQILRIIRIVRIFKLVRHSTGLQVLGYTVKESSEELGLLFLLLMMGVTLFSTLVYYAEENVPGTKFKSIFEAFWWATVSMTTVGYGDMNPSTNFGKLVGCMCCLSGILFIALPIPTIVGNFSKYYSEHRNKRKMDLHRSENETPDEFNDHFSSSIERARRFSYYRQRTSIVKPANFVYDFQELYHG